MFSGFVTIAKDDQKQAKGIIRILKVPENGRCRVIMRNSAKDEVLLNHYILPNVKIEIDGPGIIEYKTKDYACPKLFTEPVKIKIVFLPERANDKQNFVAAFEKGQKNNLDLLKMKIIG